jgi:hypothetical protein
VKTSNKTGVGYPHLHKVGDGKSSNYNVSIGLILNFHGFLEEKLLATKPCRAIFAIPKNDVETTHLEGTDR